MPLDVNQALLNAARLSRVAVPMIRIWPGGATTPISLCGGRSRRHDGMSYRGLLMELPRGARGFDILTHEPITGNWELRFNNGEYTPGQRLSDKLAQIQNRDMEIRIWVPGLTTWLSCPVYMRGRIGIPKHDDRQVVLEVEDLNSIMHRKVPGMVGSSDAADGVVLPEESLGKAKPFIGGDHRGYRGDISDVSLTTASNINNHVPCVYRGLNTSGKHEWLVAGHLSEAIDKVWAFHSGIGRKVEVVPADWSDVSAGGETIIEIDSNPSYYDYVYGDGTTSGTPGEVAVVNPEYSNDKDLSTYAEQTITADRPVTDNTREQIDFSSYVSPVDDSLISEVRVFAKAYWEMGSALTAGNVASPINNADVSTEIAENTVGLMDCGTQAATEAGVNNHVVISLERNLTGANTECYVRVYEIWKRVKFTDPNTFMPVLFDGRGIEWGPEINGRSTSEGYTESHVDDDGEGALIENGAGLLEKAYRELIDRNAEHLAENKIGISPTKWDKTGFFIWATSGALLNFPITSNLSGTIKQTAANRLRAGKPFVSYRLKYKIGVSTAPNGDFEMFLPAGGFAEGKIDLAFTAGIHEVMFISGSGAATADLVIQSSETTATQGILSVNDIYLEIDELDLDALNVASNDVSGIKLAPALVERVGSDRVIGEIARQCRLYPWVQPNGTIKVRALENTYSGEDLVIDLKRCRFMKPPEWTPLDWLKTRVKVLYNWNGERYLSQTDFAEDEDQQDYYNVTAEETTEWLECRGIHELASAEAVRDWWLAQWKQLHIRFPLWVPLDYFHIDAGDVARFTNAPYKVFNEDIMANRTRSGQMIYKYFLATKVEPWVDGAVVHFFNLHDLSA